MPAGGMITGMSAPLTLRVAVAAEVARRRAMREQRFPELRVVERLADGPVHPGQFDHIPESFGAGDTMTYDHRFGYTQNRCASIIFKNNHSGFVDTVACPVTNGYEVSQLNMTIVQRGSVCALLILTIG